MGQRVDWGWWWRARMKVEPFFGEVRYKKRGQLLPPILYSIAINRIIVVI
jgi:hypothetical protein